jgi:FAD/FMN-containing dehydrogenase
VSPPTPRGVAGATLPGMSTTTATLTSPLAAALRDRGFVGRLVAPGDPGYDDARAGWNGAIDRRPAAVAHATDADDVAAAVRAARAAGVAFTIRAGGHSVSGRSVRDGALCIDLRALDAVEVDAASAVVRVGGGALLGQLDAATQKHGLAVPAGQISHTGVGGLTLGGGLGWLMRAHGLTVDSLLGAEVVLADGRLVRASAEEHPDLFWALRGGGGDFGVVTRFELRAHRVGPAVLAGLMAYPWERARDAMRASRSLMAGAPDELTIFDVLLTAPPQEPFPPELQGRPVAVVAVAWTGDPAEGERVLAPLRAQCPPVLDLVGEMPYVALQTMLDETAPHGRQYYDRLHYLPEVGDGFIDALLAGFERTPSPHAHVMTAWMGGAIDRVAAGETAFGHRRARALSWIIGCSADEPVGEVADWVRSVWEDTAPYASDGVYVNALDEGRPVRDAYADEIWERLVAVKRRYDPDGAFSGNGIG